MCVNLETKEILEADSLNELASKYFDKNKVSAINQTIHNNTLYLNKYKIFYTIKSVSTIEN